MKNKIFQKLIVNLIVVMYKSLNDEHSGNDYNDDCNFGNGNTQQRCKHLNFLNAIEI